MQSVPHYTAVIYKQLTSERVLLVLLDKFKKLRKKLCSTLLVILVMLHLNLHSQTTGGE